MAILKYKFFNRGTIEVARELLGKVLVRRIGGKMITLVINETEAYDGPDDKASHASCGLTERNKIMFDEGGNFYIYLIYGVHWMLNITTGPKNYPAAVLIRGGFTADGENINGPGRAAKYLRIDKSFNGKRAMEKNSLWFEDHGIKIERGNILAGKRIGVGYAGEWSEKLYNFKFNK